MYINRNINYKVSDILDPKFIYLDPNTFSYDANVENY